MPYGHRRDHVELALAHKETESVNGTGDVAPRFHLYEGGTVWLSVACHVRHLLLFLVACFPVALYLLSFSAPQEEKSSPVLWGYKQLRC